MGWVAGYTYQAAEAVGELAGPGIVQAALLDDDRIDNKPVEGSMGMVTVASA